MNKTKTLITVIVAIAVVAVLAVLGYFLVSFIRNGQKSFYLAYGEQRINSGTTDLKLPGNSTVYFTGRTIAGTNDTNTQVDGYTVSVVADQKLVNNVKFRIDEGKEQYLNGDTDYSKYFKLKKEGATFSVYSPLQVDFMGMMSDMYPGKNIQLTTDLPTEKDGYFKLKVEYGAENIIIYIPLKVTLI